jgi:hypothetical protein
MDLLSRIAGWLGENEATISAVVGIAVLAGIVFAGVRWLLLRGSAGTPQKLLVRSGRRTVLVAAPAALLLALGTVMAWLIWPGEPATETASKEALLTGDAAAQFFGKLKNGNIGRKPFSARFRKPIWTPVSFLVTLRKPS